MLAYAGHLPAGRLRPTGNKKENINELNERILSMNELIVITYLLWTLALILFSLWIAIQELKNSRLFKYLKEYAK